MSANASIGSLSSLVKGLGYGNTGLSLARIAMESLAVDYSPFVRRMSAPSARKRSSMRS